MPISEINPEEKPIRTDSVNKVCFIFTQYFYVNDHKRKMKKWKQLNTNICIYISKHYQKSYFKVP